MITSKWTIQTRWRDYINGGTMMGFALTEGLFKSGHIYNHNNTTNIETLNKHNPLCLLQIE
jgi:hypothetical protein